MATDAIEARAVTPPRLRRPSPVELPRGFEIDAADTVVDVGCGEGRICAYAGQQGADVIGVDIDPECIRLAEAAMQGTPARSWRGIVSGCDPIPLPDATASAVICTEVLEHVDDPARFLEELARIGRPDARYLISVPDPASESVMRIVAPRWYWEKPYHQHVYDHETVDAMLQSAGLVIEARGLGGFDASLWWIFRMALGAQPHDPTPDAPLLRDWERTWSALLATPRGRQVAEALDALVPKSQILVARKDLGAPRRAPSRGAGRSRALWKRRLRDGAIRLGDLDIRWSVRRASRRPER